MKKQYANLAEVWFDQHYQKQTLWQIIKCWINGIDMRRSAVINFGAYMETLKETK